MARSDAVANPGETMQEGEGIRVRPATPADVPAISFIIRELGWFDYINDEPPADTEERVSQF